MLETAAVPLGTLPKSSGLSVVVPTYNERGNVTPLVHRISSTLVKIGVEFELIFVDDGSLDGTPSEIADLATAFPVSFYPKEGSKGKGFSLIQGFGLTKFDLVAFIDADLQYPPEDLEGMLELLGDGYDMIVANRIYQDGDLKRKISGFVFRNFFGKLLHNLEVDVQSGLKVFRKSVLRHTHLHPQPWAFDLEFLLQVRDGGGRIGSLDIKFHERVRGESKVSILSTSYELAVSALKLKLQRIWAHLATDNIKLRMG